MSLDDRNKGSWHAPKSLVCLASLVALAGLLAGATPRDEDEDQRVQVVSNHRKHCPHAEFTTIQDAVNAASPGDKIGESKNNLRIQARGESGSVVVDGMNHALMAGFLLQDAK